jgi:hypothetical protein
LVTRSQKQPASDRPTGASPAVARSKTLTTRIFAHARHKFALPQSFYCARQPAASENE